LPTQVGTPKGIPAETSRKIGCNYIDVKSIIDEIYSKRAIGAAPSDSVISEHYKEISDKLFDKYSSLRLKLNSCDYIFNRSQSFEVLGSLLVFNYTYRINILNNAEGEPKYICVLRSVDKLTYTIPGAIPEKIKCFSR
jgi:hypothetical protein